MEKGKIACPCGLDFKGTKEEILPQIEKHVRDVHPEELEPMTMEEILAKAAREFVSEA